MAMANQSDVVGGVRSHPELLPSPSIPSNRVGCARECCTAQMLVRNYSNFKRSGSPARVMYYEGGSWSDFSGAVMDSIREAFAAGKAVVEVGIGGGLYLFDLYRMLQVDLGSGNQRSVAWIDVDGKCFFPKIFVDGGGDFVNHSGDSKIEVEVKVGRALNSSKKKKESEGIESGECSSNDKPGLAKRPRINLASPRWPNAKLLKEGKNGYSIVENLFMTGVGIVESGAKITSIYRCFRSDPLNEARYEAFQKQTESTKAARGNPKTSFAWYGTSAEEVQSILSHGFGVPSKISGSEAHGVGIYLSPVRSPLASSRLSDVDSNGEKHVILCRVILGKCEKVEAGSLQMYPSSVDFDTGVDDLENPKWYVVWCANMHTHILPECVVSYKSSDIVPGQRRGSLPVIAVPSSSTDLFAKLLSKLESTLPSSKIQELQPLFAAYKDGKVAKDAVMKQLRSVVGGDMLVSVIHDVRD
ncbi:probable inactive poly [ADP-ribose] polymerase SRO3 isoform X1 [Actinidia eriantha]|uniref:probable inactive poly [ADP-ribose] polymerase SRO3 isoform X1 n=1 Tax=Actinidia eriantha TaxID=165200 RepID=UPI002588D16A|nr:probable inactive poly [ADP-ribose] polymerase SRO3 isoform X1 [Actinidia eriantha]XP_057469734.1 probable inactive poly [ADP-ribose] polymerase SRO3 isoform X1 [Actinidia eriantha]XP_057469735.1 probable inactive poly [ADP-ribose] polymerase SRO3 isoform X1 [Actinidia eriantha]XP_057469736.1 probable inactive poly [ADP-ribose] polymerase SRO3 isoform X1 [Actinidia eriantha]XP_057469737.1 probable inactive poly [ADP-ribose] polymerase SRO3 isoform X1 [Actinidia eriantha]